MRIAVFAASTDFIPYGVQYEEKEYIMKHTFTFTSLVVAGLLATTPVFAAEQWLAPETESGILHEMEQPGYVGTSSYVGTSLSDTRPRIHVFGEPNSAFPNPDVDESGFVIGTSGPEKGEGDFYGSVLYDVGAMQ
jgi:hypothetical protein